MAQLLEEETAAKASTNGCWLTLFRSQLVLIKGSRHLLVRGND